MSRLIRSFGFAWNGIKICTTKQANFRIHIFCTILVIVAGYYFNISYTEWLVVSISVGSVICMEMINTAIEELCNMVHRERHPAIKTIKDIAAAAVLVCAVMAIVCGSIIFIPKILSLIKSIHP